MMPSPPPLPDAPPRPGWWRRNLFWVVPVLMLGCLGMVVGAAALFAWGVLGAIRSSEPYVFAMRRAESHPAAIAALGQPIEAGWAFNGEMQSANGSGEAALVIPVSGPRGEGDLTLEAEMTADTWKIVSLVLAVDGRAERIDLLGDDAVPAAGQDRAKTKGGHADTNTKADMHTGMHTDTGTDRPTMP